MTHNIILQEANTVNKLTVNAIYGFSANIPKQLLVTMLVLIL